MITAEQLTALRLYFSGRSEVAMAFLFGSQARGTATRLSDTDIAVYFVPHRSGVVEVEEEYRYSSEDDIRDDCERLLHREVELLVMNRAAPVVASGAVRGLPLVLRDAGLYLDFLLTVSREAEDFRQMLFRDFMEERRRAGRTEAKTP
jgi:predicted nucleotidyltransferase